MKRYWLSVIVIVAAIGIPFLLIHSGEKEAMSGDERITRAMLNRALMNAVAIAEKNYYEPVDSDKMYLGAIKGALAAIGDAYTYYISAEEHQRSVENLYNAEFPGLGINIYQDHRGFIKISSPIPGTPAASHGLRAGDYITKVDGTRIHLSERTGMTINDVVDMLRGKLGTEVTITVQREFLEPFDVTLTRARISIPSVTSTMLEDSTGYIHIKKFIGSGRKQGTEAEFNDALAAHEAAGMKALILDLRDNQGGLLNAAYHIADAFIDKGLIVSTRNERRHVFNEEYPASPKLLCDKEIPLVILVNEYSASASEIVAGAVKDTRRGILVGQKTFGKGVVQKRYPLGPGDTIGAMSLTISTYYTPNGTSIHKEGITPHVPVSLEKYGRVERAMQRMANEKDAVEDFVAKWIVDELKRTGETPKAFEKLEAALPALQQSLAEDSIRVGMRWLKLRAEQEFNRNVGIERVVNLEYDTQLQEAIRILTEGEIDKYLNPLPEEDADSLSSAENEKPAEEKAENEKRGEE